MRIGHFFFIDPEKNTNKYSDFINYIDTSSVNSGFLIETQHLENDFPSRANKRVIKNDILFSYVRPYLKHYYFFKDDIEHAIVSTGFSVIRQKEKTNICAKFVYYFLTSNSIVQYLSSIAEASQSTFPCCNKNDIEKIELPNFEIFRQQKIASILSDYDDLIENNNKRIKLLEEMAQEVYKEWFIHFRYPGFEKSKFNNDMPKGWTLSSCVEISKPVSWKFDEFSKIAKFIRGENITSAEMIAGGIPVISAGLDPSGYHNEYNVKGDSLTISASGANAGYLSYHLTNIWAADCSFCQSDNIWFVYNTLKFLQPVISNLQCGSAQPHVYPKNINELCVVVPDKETIKLYCEKVDAIYGQIKILQQKNDNLAKQRDLLLPRLMKGELI